MVPWPSLVTGVSLLFAAPTPPDPGRIPDENIEALVNQLVSPNRAPEEQGDIVKYPDGYDRAAQKRVRAAEQSLYRAGTAAFPHLIRALMTSDTAFRGMAVRRCET